MFAFLLIVQTLIAVSLIGVILMQRSEGGGLGVGGSSSGFHDGARRGRLPHPLDGGPRRAVHRSFDRHGGDCRRDTHADQDRHVARRQDRAPLSSRSRRRSSRRPRRRNGESAAEPAGARRFRSRNNRGHARNFFRAAGCVRGVCPPKPRIPWRGSYLSPAAWFHRLEKVFFPRPSGRFSRRAATRSGSGSSIPI